MKKAKVQTIIIDKDFKRQQFLKYILDIKNPSEVSVVFNQIISLVSNKKNISEIIIKLEPTDELF
jgi:hypothetical protein